jgi:hypothetical protein
LPILLATITAIITNNKVTIDVFGKINSFSNTPIYIIMLPIVIEAAISKNLISLTSLNVFFTVLNAPLLE